MKNFLLVLFLFIGFSSMAQSKIASFSVEGNCGMCKKTIEKAALDAGAEKAIWNKKTKKLKVKFNSTKTTEDRIKKQIAEAGYSNETYQANDSAYQKLPDCCHYKNKSNKTH